MDRLRLCCTLACLTLTRLWAHDPGLSTTQVVIRDDRLVASIGFAPADVRLLLPAPATAPPAPWTAADFAAVRPALLALATHLLAGEAEGAPIAWRRVSVALASADSVIFRLEAPAPAGPFSLHPLGLDRLPPGHRDYLSVADAGGVTRIEKLLTAKDPAVVVTGAARAVAAPRPTFWGFLRLGIAHIWTGYDHLLFLFGLLIVCRSFRSIVAIISCFTVAHSITLALATLDVINLPGRVVEPMIAASILFVGLENLACRGAEPRGRWALTFAFGLIHGFGFASALRELGVGANGHGLALPLLTFNLGVEIGQITIAALALPVVWQLRKHAGFGRRGVPILSGLVATAGLYWLLERTLF